jgi:hypothetical protein
MFGVVVAVSAVCAVATSAPASADTAAYLQHLADLGIKTPGGDPELKEWGWEVCALQDRGVPADKVIAQAVYNSGRGPQYGITDEQAQAVVHFATADLCNDRR